MAQDCLTDIFMARQPILDRKQSLYGYEVLFRRNGSDQVAKLHDSICATSNVLAHMFCDMGFKEVVGEGRKAFVNYSETLLLDETEPFFSPKDVVIEVLENVEISEKLFRRLTQLRKKGYRIALDDYEFHPRLKPLEDYADIIKVDLMATPMDSLASKLSALSESQGRRPRLLAEKVETKEEYEFCKDLGFDLFQGFFFAKPELIQSRGMGANQLTLMRLLTKVYDPDTDIGSLINLIKSDVSISQKILRLYSSLYPDFKVTSIQDVVLRIGLRKIQSWVSIMLISGTTSKPDELLKLALTRASFCETIGKNQSDGTSSDQYFMAGLFSVLDAVLDTEMEEVATRLNLDDTIHDALVHGKGKIGQSLQCCRAIESGNMAFPAADECIPLEVTRTYLQAIAYANRVMSLNH